ncbi:MAG: recombinase family protein [Mesorhizobium sp.]
MKRAIIYARYSTDLQNDKSVEDQIALCREYAFRGGFSVIGEHHDRAKSGASIFGRTGLANVMRLAEDNAFDVLIAEAPDRISRDMEDLSGIYKRLSFFGIEMNCVNGGRLDTVQIGMYGVIGQMQREEGAKKVRRGMRGVVASGRNAGGKAYGYRPVPGKAGELEIVEDEAATVRRVFEMYAAGAAPRTIASCLNKEGVRPPRGTHWNASTINGNKERGHGILQNPIYSGRIVWNRVRMVKDPTTGKRVSRANPESEWLVNDAPRLRIVDQQLFDRVAVRKASRGGEAGRKAPRAKRVLSGLLKCGACGGGMTIIGRDRSGPRIQCSTFRESGSCSNGARYYVEKIEQQVVDVLRHQFSDTRIIDEYVRAYRDERRRIESEARRNRVGIEKALADVLSRRGKLIDKMSRDLISDEEAEPLLHKLREEKASLEEELRLAGEETNVIELHPQAVTRFKENIENLAAILADGETPDADIVGPFRELVATVVVSPRERGGPYEIQIKGYLSTLLGADLSAMAMVAEEGFEPPTQGL